MSQCNGITVGGARCQNNCDGTLCHIHAKSSNAAAKKKTSTKKAPVKKAPAKKAATKKSTKA